MGFVVGVSATTTRSCLGAHPIPDVFHGPFPWGKAPECETDHLPASSAEIKNA
jgi:hypothetical protein